MNFKDTWLYRSLALFAACALTFGSSTLLAQDEIESTDVEAEIADLVESADSEDSVEEVVVTGSRLKRSTFTSISPLQIVNAEISREAGLLNAAEILQTSTSANGQQVDLTFSGFVLDNGPGSRTINLRGLGADRTLVLINGRRMAPGGAEGAPYSPNVGSIPQGLVANYELLTDGASSIYGSDAIGGVTNIILRKDLDGLAIQGGTTNPKYDGGETDTLTLTWGKVYDKGFIDASLNITSDLWFFDCHFIGDPVMPGCLGLDAMWQLVGFYLGWSQYPGKGRALGVGEVKFTGQILPTAKKVTYKIHIKRLITRKLIMGIGDGIVSVDGREIYIAKDLRVGLFTSTEGF